MQRKDERNMKYTIKDFLAGKVSIRCNNADESNAVLKVCEENGVTWRFGRAIRTHIPSEPVLTVGYYNDGCLTHGDGCHRGMIVVNYDEIDFSDAPRYQIVIESDGDTTTAKMVVNGREIKTATAKRNPADKANWRTGAQVAFDRLWQKQEKPDKQKKDGVFHVGDRVVCVASINGNRYVIGKHGTVVDANDSKCLGVEFDEYVNGNALSLSKLCLDIKNGHGWWCSPGMLCHEQPTKPKVREVKRQAKGGEYIKLTKKSYSFDKVGLILRVDKVNGCAVVLQKNHPTSNPKLHNNLKFPWAYTDDAYVVLEGYQPGRDA